MNELLFFCLQLINKWLPKIVEKDFIYYNIIAIKWGESTHFPGRTGNRGETTQIQIFVCHSMVKLRDMAWR